MLTRFKTLALAATAIISTVAFAAPASATVVYSYDRPGLGSFVYAAPDFISTYTNAAVTDLARCSIIAAFGTCGTQSFEPDNSLFGGATHDAVIVFRGTNNGTFFDYFGVGAFSAFGTYNDTRLNNGAVLTVSGGAVPEPAGLAAIAGGLAVLALRRRQRA